MKLTSAEANKLLRKLQDNKTKLLADEREMMTYHAAISEDEKNLKPADYDFSSWRKAEKELDDEIMKLKHAINLFNLTTEVKDGMTVDEVLIRLPQLNERIRTLNPMRLKQSKKRSGIVGNVIDYVYTSYDPQDADNAYSETADEIAELQLALDKVNTTIKFEY